MEKILVVLNANGASMHTIDFACKIAKAAASKLTGLLIENIFYQPGHAVLKEEKPYFKDHEEQQVADLVITDTEQAIRLFKDECRLKGVEAEVYVDKGEPIQEAIFESRFADLLVVDPSISFYEKEDGLPSHLVKEILANAECPVLLAPEQFGSVEEIIFCYDGSASSVYAIKQFTYLMSHLKHNKLILLEVNSSGKEEFTDSHRRMLEWLKAHYASVSCHSLQGNAHDELFTYFFMKQNKLIVMGAYGRSILSNFFKRSTADVLLRAVDLPLFIAHH